eukprot:GDKI01035431.1.p2 GENE.GDKI01035431.1~~GDKI01035431.1.p2  ORF type:complete len:104 (+),score=31.97 GDKI01035431.1:163-474(+)
MSVFVCTCVCKCECARTHLHLHARRGVSRKHLRVYMGLCVWICVCLCVYVMGACYFLRLSMCVHFCVFIHVSVLVVFVWGGGNISFVMSAYVRACVCVVNVVK